MMKFSIIQKVYLWDGMANQYLTGFTNCMVLAKNSNVKSVVVQAIGVEERSRSISKNGVMHTV